VRYLDIINERIETVTIDSVPARGGRAQIQMNARRIKVLVNPSRAAFIAFVRTAKGRLRFTVSQDDELYIWAGYGAIHFDILNNLGVEEQFSGYITVDGILLHPDESIRDMAPRLRANSHILDAMGGAAFKVAHNNEEIDDF
jgi:hypothetical protein